jgi:DNA-binding XRE family transcriptional regulator
MKPLEIKGARTRLGLSQKYMAEQLHINVVTYGKKERGIVRFTPEEMVIVARLLEFNLRQFNDYFFDGQMPAS